MFRISPDAKLGGILESEEREREREKKEREREEKERERERRMIMHTCTMLNIALQVR